VDWRRMRRCLAPRCGPHAVLTVAEYLSLHRTKAVKVGLFAALGDKRVVHELSEKDRRKLRAGVQQPAEGVRKIEQ